MPTHAYIASLSSIYCLFLTHLQGSSISSFPSPFFGTRHITFTLATQPQRNEPPGFYQGSALDTDRDGLSRRAAPTVGRGDDACAASVVQAGLIFTSSQAGAPSYFFLAVGYV